MRIMSEKEGMKLEWLGSVKWYMGLAKRGGGGDGKSEVDGMKG